jgi:hypothetical protein
MDFFYKTLDIISMMHTFQSIATEASFFMYVPFVTGASTYQAGAAWSEALTQLHSTKTPTHAAVVFSHARRHDNSAFLHSEIVLVGTDASASSGSVQKYERLQL